MDSIRYYLLLNSIALMIGHEKYEYVTVKKIIPCIFAILFLVTCVSML